MKRAMNKNKKRIMFLGPFFIWFMHTIESSIPRSPTCASSNKWVHNGRNLWLFDRILHGPFEYHPHPKNVWLRVRAVISSCYLPYQRLNHSWWGYDRARAHSVVGGGVGEGGLVIYWKGVWLSYYKPVFEFRHWVLAKKNHLDRRCFAIGPRTAELESRLHDQRKTVTHHSWPLCLPLWRPPERSEESGRRAPIP
jgi:hypothetical protein